MWKKSHEFSRRTVAALAASAAMMALLAQPAAASEPFAVTGTQTFTTSAVVSVRTADGNTILVADFTEQIVGAYTGTATGEFTLTTHPDGTSNLRGEFTCVCTMAGHTGFGTFTTRFSGTGDSAGVTTGQYRIVASSGDLSGSHGEGTFTAVGAAGTYSGLHHFDP